MLYRDHREYEPIFANPEHEHLRSWLRGETGIESLKKWLVAIQN